MSKREACKSRINYLTYFFLYEFSSLISVETNEVGLNVKDAVA